MLPTVGSDTLKIIAYAAEVAGRTLGIAALKNLVPDPERRAAVQKSGDKMLLVTKQVGASYVARLLFEAIDSRVAVGKGRGVDKGFDAGISVISETVRTSLPDRTTKNPDYRSIFPNGTHEYISPTVKEDDGLAADLRQRIEASALAVKADILEVLDELIPVVGPASAEVRSTEKQVNDLFQGELAGRKQIIDTLWEERKNVETALGRSGRGFARFIFFDFRSPGAKATEDDPPSPSDPDAPEGPK